MDCPACGSPMTLLFTSYACDVCDGKVKKETKDTDIDHLDLYYKGLLSVDQIMDLFGVDRDRD